MSREIDTLVAKNVLKLEVCECDHDALKLKHYKDWQERCRDPYLEHSFASYFSHGSDKNCNHCGMAYMPVRTYSTDISMAWEVVDKLTEDGATVAVVGSSDWECEISLNDGRFLTKADTTVFGTADTAPLSICIAALRAVGAK